jgi:hypothetical protein
VDFIDLAQDSDWWRTDVNAVMNFCVLGIVGKILNSCVTAGFPRMELVQYRNYTASDGRLICLVINCEMISKVSIAT